MSAHIVFAVPCLWQWGIHSLQGLPSILLIKQWLCTQPIQGRENATQRDKNIKHLAIWGGRVPNNDSLVIMEALFFFSPVTPQKIVDEGGICVSIDLTMHSCDVGQILLSYMKSKQTHEIFHVKKSCQIKDTDLFKTPPPNLNSLPCNLFYTCFCCHQGQSCS